MTETAVGYVALGSNLGDRRANLAAGITGLAELGLRPGRRSSIWETEPVDTEQPQWFLNMVVRIETSKPALEVLDDLLEIERSAGRTRTATPNSPRTLDLDLLILGPESVTCERLTLPHPRMWDRRFVLAPLAEIDPDLVNSRTGKTVERTLRELDDRFAVRRLHDSVAASATRPL